MDKTLAQLWFIKKSEFRLGFIISLSKFAPRYNIKYCIIGGFAMSGVWPDSSITAGEHLTNLEA